MGLGRTKGQNIGKGDPTPPPIRKKQKRGGGTKDPHYIPKEEREREKWPCGGRGCVRTLIFGKKN